MGEWDDEDAWASFQGARRASKSFLTLSMKEERDIPGFGIVSRALIMLMCLSLTNRC